MLVIAYLSDGVDLGRTSSSSDLHSDVESAGSLLAQQEQGLEGLGPEGGRLDQLDGGSVHLDDS
jgi:hypothetical protein